MSPEPHLMAKRSGEPRGKKPKIHEKGRECDLRGCGQELTQFNPGPFCYLHTPKSYNTRVRGKRTTVR
jgi:hypothetical protein